MNDTWIQRLTAASVLLVAAIAATVSFVHIEHLAASAGQTLLAAILLPLSIDGTVAAASTAMLLAARAGIGTPWLARTMLTLAVAATLAANIGYGIPHGATGALISGWPAVAFIGCAEMAIAMVRRTRAASAPQDAPQPRTMDTAPPAPVAAPEPAHQPETRRAPKRTRTPRTMARPAPTPEAVAARFDGAVPSQRQVMREFRVSRPKAMELLASLSDRETATIGAVNGTAHSTTGRG